MLKKNAFAPPRDRKDTAIVLEQLFQCFNLLQFHVHDSLYTFVMFFSFKYIVTLQLQLLVCLLHDLCETERGRNEERERWRGKLTIEETTRQRGEETKRLKKSIMLWCQDKHPCNVFCIYILHCKCKLNDKMRLLVPNSSLRMSLSLSSVQVTLSCLRKTKHSNWLHTIFQSQICATGAV